MDRSRNCSGYWPVEIPSIQCWWHWTGFVKKGKPISYYFILFHSFSYDTMELPLIIFSAFERVALESDDKMHRMGKTIQLYEPGPLSALEPIMKVGYFSHVLCRVPLIPCFMDGSDHPTIPRRFVRSTLINHHGMGMQTDNQAPGMAASFTKWICGCGTFDEGCQGLELCTKARELKPPAAISRTKQHANLKRNRNDR